MKNIRALIFIFCLVQVTYGAEPSLESVFLDNYFSNVTLSPGRITLTARVRVHFDKEDESSRLLERGETISLTPGFTEVHFVGRHDWISIKRIGSGNEYELTSAFDHRPFGKELEESKYHLIFSPTELVFKGVVPTVVGGKGSPVLWGLVAVLIVVALGLSWFLFRRRK